MTESQPIAILVPLAAGTAAIVWTVFTHALAVGLTVNLVRHEKGLGRVGAGFWVDVLIVGAATLVVFAAHLFEIASWAVLLLVCGEFRTLGAALYHSAALYTTLGYNDVMMTPSWALLGPLEAVNGVLMFGVSTAMIFAVIQRLIQARFPDLNN